MLERSSQNSMRKKQAAITACEKRDAQRRRTSWRHARAMEEGRHDQTPAQVCGRKIRMQKCRRPSGCSRQPGYPKLRFGPVALRPRLASGVLFASPRRLPEGSETMRCDWPRKTPRTYRRKLVPQPYPQFRLIREPPACSLRPCSTAASPTSNPSVRPLQPEK